MADDRAIMQRALRAELLPILRADGFTGRPWAMRAEGAHGAALFGIQHARKGGGVRMELGSLPSPVADLVQCPERVWGAPIRVSLPGEFLRYEAGDYVRCAARCAELVTTIGRRWYAAQQGFAAVLAGDRYGRALVACAHVDRSILGVAASASLAPSLEAWLREQLDSRHAHLCLPAAWILAKADDDVGHARLVAWLADPAYALRAATALAEVHGWPAPPADELVADVRQRVAH